MNKKPFVALLALSLALSAMSWTAIAGASENSVSSSVRLTFGTAAFGKDAVIEETVLVDEQGIKITATELTYENYSAELVLLIENNTDRDLTFIANSLAYSCNSVNGYMVPEGYLNCDVTAGKKAITSVSFGYEDLMMPYGIYEIADIEIGFMIKDDDSNYIYTGPRAVSTSIAEGYDYEATCCAEIIASKDAQDQFGYSVPHYSTDLAYEGNGMSIVSQTVIVDKDGESSLFLEVANNSGSTVRVSTSDIKINGLGIYESECTSDVVNPGKTAVVGIGLSSLLKQGFWDEYGIAELGSVGLKVTFEGRDGSEMNDQVFLSFDIPGVEAGFNTEGTEVYNGNGLRIVSKGIYADPTESSGDLHILLVAENTSGRALQIGDVYDSFTVNDFMIDCSFYSTVIEDGTWAAIDVRLWESDLEDLYITGASDIETVEFGLEIEDENYELVDEPVVSFSL